MVQFHILAYIYYAKVVLQIIFDLTRPTLYTQEKEGESGI